MLWRLEGFISTWAKSIPDAIRNRLVSGDSGPHKVVEAAKHLRAAILQVLPPCNSEEAYGLFARRILVFPIIGLTSARRSALISARSRCCKQKTRETKFQLRYREVLQEEVAERTAELKKRVAGLRTFLSQSVRTGFAS